MTVELCHCSQENPQCLRAGRPMIGEFWKICSGNCPELIAKNPNVSEQARTEWDRRAEARRNGLPEIPTAQGTQKIRKPMGLGDEVEKALSIMGITKDRVESWLGEPCNCPERREKLNSLGFWAQRVISGKIRQAKLFLGKLIGDRDLVREDTGPTPLETKPVSKPSRVEIKDIGITEEKIEMKWAYGITTIPGREILLLQSIASLSRAGFTNPDLYIDGCSNQKAVEFEEKFKLRVSARNPSVRPYSHWVLSLWEIYARNPHCDRYAIFQDDIIACASLREYLTYCPYPENGYWNLYTASENYGVCPRKAGPQGLPNSGIPVEGWYSPTLAWKGIGALGLVFDKKALLNILQAKNIVEKPQEPHRGWKKIDGAVYTALDQHRYKEYVHNPSLLQHTGMESSMGSDPNKSSPCFRSETWSPLSLIGR